MNKVKMIWLALGGVWILLASGLQAQFHAKTETGQIGVNQQAVNSAQQQAVAGAMSNPAAAALGGGDMVLPEGQRRALSQYNARLGKMGGKPVDIWGRAIYHSDESYTESKQDNKTHTLQQITKSKNGTRLQSRMIMLDGMGRPSEVMIYDGRDQLKYRGVQLYDSLGRFCEEQLFDIKGTMLRRRIQGYTPQGQKLPLHSVDLVANVPADLKLVITREEEPPPVKAEPENKPRTGLFGRGQKPMPLASGQTQSDRAPAPRSDTQAGSPETSANAAPEPPKRGLNLGRLFGGKKRE